MLRVKLYGEELWSSGAQKCSVLIGGPSGTLMVTRGSSISAHAELGGWSQELEIGYWIRLESPWESNQNQWTWTSILLTSVFISFISYDESATNQSRTFRLHLSDIDECESGELCGPNSHCHNTNGSFYCTCQRDYIPTSGTQHFQAERGVRCKGQYEDRKAHLHKCRLQHAHSLPPRTFIFLHRFFCNTSRKGEAWDFLMFRRVLIKRRVTWCYGSAGSTRCLGCTGDRLYPVWNHGWLPSTIKDRRC